MIIVVFLVVVACLSILLSAASLKSRAMHFVQEYGLDQQSTYITTSHVRDLRIDLISVEPDGVRLISKRNILTSLLVRSFDIVVPYTDLDRVMLNGFVLSFHIRDSASGKPTVKRFFWTGMQRVDTIALKNMWKFDNRAPVLEIVNHMQKKGVEVSTTLPEKVPIVRYLVLAIMTVLASAIVLALGWYVITK